MHAKSFYNYKGLRRIFCFTKCLQTHAWTKLLYDLLPTSNYVNTKSNRVLEIPAVQFTGWKSRLWNSRVLFMTRSEIKYSP